MEIGTFTAQSPEEQWQCMVHNIPSSSTSTVDVDTLSRKQDRIHLQNLFFHSYTFLKLVCLLYTQDICRILQKRIECGLIRPSRRRLEDGEKTNTLPLLTQSLRFSLQHNSSSHSLICTKESIIILYIISSHPPPIPPPKQGNARTEIKVFLYRPSI